MTWVPHGTDGRIAKANAAQVADINGAVAHPTPPDADEHHVVNHDHSL